MPNTSNVINFSDLNIGEEAQLIDYASVNTAYRKKLMNLGLLPGTRFKIIRKAPLGDPIELHFRGFNLTLRKNEACSLQVMKV